MNKRPSQKPISAPVKNNVARPQFKPLEAQLSVQDLALFIEMDTDQLKKELEKKKFSVYRNSIAPSDVRRFLSQKGFSLPQKTVSFQMLKGGVAKTTSAYNFGIRAAMYGARVLFVDLDQQANLTFALGVDNEDLPVWVDIFEKKTNIKDAILKLGLVDLIPSSLNNSVLDRSLLNSNRNWALSTRSALKEVLPLYDLIIFDTAPHLSAVNTSVTCASDMVVLPVTPDKFAFLGLKKHLADLSELKNEFDLKFSEKILFTKFDGRESTSHDILEQCLGMYEELLLKTFVRISADVKNTIGEEKTIYNNKSAVKDDYDMITRELLDFI